MCRWCGALGQWHVSVIHRLGSVAVSTVAGWVTVSGGKYAPDAFVAQEALDWWRRARAAGDAAREIGEIVVACGEHPANLPAQLGEQLTLWDGPGVDRVRADPWRQVQARSVLRREVRNAP